jgi:hypothetical protein
MTTPSNPLSLFFNNNGQATIYNTTASVSTTTGALVIGGGLGIGNNLFTGGNISLAATGTATTSTVSYGSPSINLNSSVWDQASTATFNTGFQIQAQTPAQNQALLLIQSNNATRTPNGSDYTFVRVNGQNSQLQVMNSNDNLGVQFMETYYAGWMGLANTSPSISGSVPANGYLNMFAMANTGTVGSVVYTTGIIAPTFRTVIDDGAGNVTVGANTGTTTGRLLVKHTTSATSTTTGALQVAGGAGIGGSLWVGTTATIGSNSTNYFQIYGGQSGSSATIATVGSDSNIDINVLSKGLGSINFGNGDGLSLKLVDSGAYDSSYLTIAGSVTSQGQGYIGPTIAVAGTDTNIGLNIYTVGGGIMNVNAGGLGSTATGTSIRMGVNGKEVLRVQGSYSIVNKFSMQGGGLGSSPQFIVSTTGGVDPNVGVDHGTQGTGAFRFYTGNVNAGFGWQQLQISHSTATTGYVNITGGTASLSTTPTLSTTGTDALINLNITTRGAGSVVVTNTTTAVSTQTGALIVNGGVGIGGNLWVGGTINGTANTASNATTSSNLVVYNNTTSAAIQYLTFVSTSTGSAVLQTAATSGIVYQPSTGFMGIGTTSTLISPLHVSLAYPNPVAEQLTPSPYIALTLDSPDTNPNSAVGMDFRNFYPGYGANGLTTSTIIYDFQGGALNAGGISGPGPTTGPGSWGMNYISGRSGFAHHWFRDSSYNVQFSIVNNGTVASGYMFQNYSAPAYSHLIQGSVGIGTTVTNAALTVLGGQTITGIFTSTNATQSNNTVTGALIIAGGIGVGGNVNVNGSLNAITKSFVITHPTKPNMKLRYGSLEGPENGVYVRGRLKGSTTIQLPDYWTKLVDPDSITVTLTPIGKHQKLYVEAIKDNTVIVENDAMFGGSIDCYYVVFAERADTDKLAVEISE